MHLLLHRIGRRCKQESGQAVLLFAICLPVMLAACALAIDIALLRDQQAQLQSAADAAALAAALAIPRCNGVQDCSLMQTAALQAMAENGYSQVTLNIQCNTSKESGVVLTLNNGPCEASSDPNYGQPVYVEAVVSKVEPTYFAHFLNVLSAPVAARAEARSLSYCMIFSADDTGSSAPPGVTLGLASIMGSISASCGLADDSGASDAFYTGLVSLGASVNTEQTVIHGGISTGLLSSISFSPPPQTYAPVVPDPLSYLTPPTPTATNTCSQHSLDILLPGNYTVNPEVECGSMMIAGVAANVTFEPGTYDGSITIASLLANVVFEPSAYYFEGNSSLNIVGVNVGGGVLGNLTGATGSVTGNGVTFYFEGGSVSMTGLVPTNLVAPSSCPNATSENTCYAGILFYQDPSDTTPMTIIGAPTSSAGFESGFQGAIYAAGAPLTVLGYNNAAYTLIDTGSLNEILDLGVLNPVVTTLLGGEAFHVNADYASLPDGSPLRVGSSVLVE